MSERSSTRPPSSCSGDMYGGVPGFPPRISVTDCAASRVVDAPVPALDNRRVALAMPKSRILTSPACVS